MMRSGLLWLSERQGVFNFVKRNGFARKFASRFVAGESLDNAITVARQLNEKGIAVSLDLLGESVSDRHEADAARDQVIEILDRINTGLTGDTNVSIKLTQMGLDLGDDVCFENLRRVLERARQHDTFVRLDMEASEYTDRTLRIFRERVHPEFGNLCGVVVQSYLRRSAEDVEALIDINARVRLCKGAYAEPAAVAFQERAAVDRSYVSLGERLLQEGNYPAIATHDERMIDATLAFVRRNNIAPERFEFQMLYGVRRDLEEKLRRQGFNTRLYVPFGTQWYPYLMRRLAERPANVMFMTMSVIKEALSGR